MDKVPVGISACLLGAEVRHDGGHKRSLFCRDTLSRYFDLRPLCPELGAGFSVPRPAMRLVVPTDQAGPARLTLSRTGNDVDKPMRNWCQRTIPQLGSLRGYVLMAKSPSCGLQRVRTYNEQGEVQGRDAAGVFAGELVRAYPLLPVEEEGRLNDPHLRENFIERVFVFDDWCLLTETQLTATKLIQFHSRRKFQLLAHCEKTYRQLGALLSDLKTTPLKDTADQYIHAFMAAMKKPAGRGAHVNVMLHVLGFFRGQLERVEREAIQQSIQHYLHQQVPLVVPMTLLRIAECRFPNQYLQQQSYLEPYPDALGLRNAI
jgi:uncharacterized protein YbgA (DUF1722 family)/uncharacterized protein YbbK (DUF523 family)